ncbi:MAG: pyridoxamine 5'-phosphate oxidase [Phycisphaeraceae bacterium]|nr:pyridoxamine 5'-phosphate oxidase [Phycisphaeraceae bacterium]
MSFISRLRMLTTFGRGVALGLAPASAERDPVELFGEWFEQAKRAGVLLPEAMTVATSTPDGRPSARMMLLKGADADGFVFFTNRDSRKGGELEANPRVALVFHWAVLQRQVRVEGDAVRVSDEESYEYFRTRPRGSQIGAWASRQSRALGRRGELEDRVRDFEAKFSGEGVPLPPFWGGFRLNPELIEFWQGRASRLHDRLSFERDDSGAWATKWLYP